MPVINGVYLKDFPALPSAVADANIIPIAIAGNQIAYRTTVAGIVTDARVTSKLLTGLSVTGSTILATDTILQAFGKVQNQLNGKVSSVGLTMPAAFNVANSPITSAGTLAVTAAGVASQYIRGDGQLADFPTGGGGGGSSVSYYLNGSVNQGTFVGNVYREMNKTPIFGAGTDFTINADGYISQFITDANDPNSLLIPAGNWNFETFFSASSGGGSPTFYIELYKYNGTAFTLIASNSATPELIAFGTTIAPYFSSLAVPETVLLATDRLAIRIYVTHSGKTITLHTENSHLCQVITTFTTGLQSLNGLTKQTQYLAVGTSGTDFAISSSVDTHMFNLPDASTTARGVMTTGTQTFAGLKTFNTTSASAGLNLNKTTNDVGLFNFQVAGVDKSYIEWNINDAGSGLGTAFNIRNGQGAIGLYDSTNTGLKISGGNTNIAGQLTLGSTITNGTYTYTLPSATGTLALVGGAGVGTVTSVAALTLGTSGSDLSSSVANGTTTPVITLNVPDASATARGVVTTGTQTIAGLKTFENSGITANFNRTVSGGAIVGFQILGVDKSFIEWNVNDAGSGVGTAMNLRNNQGAIGLYDNTNTGLKIASGSGVFAGSSTANAFIPNNSTIPTNGMYLSATNTLDFATNSTNRLSISSTGSMYVGAAIDSAAISTFVSGFNGFAAKVSNNAFFLYSGLDSSAVRTFYVLGTGDVKNTNNSYGAISDVKLKENIKDATPKLDDLLKVKIRNYNLIGDDKKQIGVIAQELEKIFPTMVDELEDFEELEVPQIDKEGNEVLNQEGKIVTTKQRVSKGTATKSVKYSVFVPMLIKAIQELKLEIDILKNN